MLLLSLNHRTSFADARRPEPDSTGQIEFFFQYPLASWWRLNEQGRPVEMLGTHLEADPRHEQSDAILKTVDLYNAMARQAYPPEVRPNPRR